MNKAENILPSGARNVPAIRIAAKSWAKKNKDISVKEFEDLITACIQDSSTLTKCMGGILLDYMPAQRKLIDPSIFEKLLDHAEGWAEVDAICYGHFTAKEMDEKFGAWKKLVIKLSRSDNMNKRRAAMVFLTKPLTQTNDKRYCELSLTIIDDLKHEKHILITKAVSWLLRKLTKYHAAEVKKYMAKNKDLLPKVALRETANKLKTGRKSGK